MTLPKGRAAMMNNGNEKLVEQTVTYSLEMNGKLFLIENVPARVSVETGEQFFSPATVERLQQIMLNQEKPVRVIETPVYNFAA
jgi:hypothetical protein